MKKSKKIVDSIHVDGAAKARATKRANEIRKMKKTNGIQKFRVSVKKGDSKKFPFGTHYVVEKTINKK